MHYNGNKFNNQGVHTFTWDNIGFDGPLLPRDLAFDVLDNQQKTNQRAMFVRGYLRNIGWYTDRKNEVNLNVPGAYNLSQATSALLTFSYYTYNAVTVSYAINNGAWQTAPWQFPPLYYTARTIAVPVNLSDVVAGANVVHFMSSDAAAIANVDIILRGAGGVVQPSGHVIHPAPAPRGAMP